MQPQRGAPLPAGLPSLLVPRRTGPLARGGGVRAGKQLSGLRLQGQHATNWCWSAVAQAVLDFMGGTTLEQADIATIHVRHGVGETCVAQDNRQNNGDPCDVAGCLRHCNDFHIIRIVLSEHDRFDAILSSDAPPSFEQVRAEIDQDRPIVCRVQWDSDGGFPASGGHFLMIGGWSIDADGKAFVHIFDPKQNEGGAIVPERILPYASFIKAYSLMKSIGHINFSYRVK